jgi:hypothetical protein
MTVTAATTADTIQSDTRTWTRELVYLRPSPFMYWPPAWTPDVFTEEFNAELNRETRWKQIAPTPTLPDDVRMQVALRKLECPLCTTRGIPVIGRGVTTGLEMHFFRPCECHALIDFWDVWQHVPKRFQDADLDTITPIRGLALSEARQATIHAALRAHPTESFLFHGPPNTAKTYMMTALYRHAVQAEVEQGLVHRDCRRAVWRMNAKTVMDQIVAWEMEKNKDIPDFRKEPVVYDLKVQRAARDGFSISLFIDEIDKLSPTDFKMAGLCSLIDKVYEAQGQVVATMNSTADELAAKYGANEAGTVLRRIGAGPRANTVPCIG